MYCNLECATLLDSNTYRTILLLAGKLDKGTRTKPKASGEARIEKRTTGGEGKLWIHCPLSIVVQ